jgi:hypothetical protein
MSDDERQEIEHLQQELAEKGRLLEQVPSSIKVISLDPIRITYWNRSSELMYGYTAAEAVGRHPGDLLHTRFEIPIEQALAHFRAEGSWRGEVIETRKDGVEIVVDLRWVLRSEEPGRPASLISVGTDISKEKAVLAELASSRDQAEAANAAKSHFLATMSHELRTPLNAILGYSELLMEQAQDEGHVDYLPDLAKIHGAGRHLLALINDVLDLAKIEAGKMEIHREAVAVADMVAKVAAIGEPLARKGESELRVEVAPDVGMVQTDGKRLEQVLMNLVSNACKFTQHGLIELKVWRDDAGLTFEVRDTGIGIPPELQERLFKPFVQGDTSRTRRYGGTGLGLAIALQLCELLGATITVTSTPGSGSTFTVRLPG